MKKMKRLSVVLSLVLCVVFLFSSSVFATDGKSLNNYTLGTQQDWQNLREEISHGDRLPNGQITTFSSGIYPSARGDILVTDAAFSWQDKKSWVGHAGIVYDYANTLEAFPNNAQTVRFHKNDWGIRYGDQDVYGLNVPAATNSERNDALQYCYKRCYSGKCYWLTAGKGSDTWINCASLMWHAYYKSCGTSISNVPSNVVITPMSLVLSEKTDIIYRNW